MFGMPMANKFMLNMPRPLSILNGKTMFANVLITVVAAVCLSSLTNWNAMKALRKNV